MLGRMIKIELYRALHGMSLKISLLIGALLAVEHFIMRVLPFLKYKFDSYHPDLAFALIPNVQSQWMSGTISAENNVYNYIVFLLVTLPYAGSFYLDKKNGVIKNVVTRGNKRYYLIAKSVASYITGGIAAVFPLILNLMLTCTVFPVIRYYWATMINSQGLFVKTALENYILYCVLYMTLIFIFGGLVAGISLSVSLYADNIFVTLSMPFLICIVSSRVLAYSKSAFIRGLRVVNVFDMGQAGPANIPAYIALFVILLVFGYLFFIIKGEKKDVL